MKKYCIIGAGNYLSDIFDIIHANNGKVVEIYHNAPESENTRGISIKQRIDLLDYDVKYYRSLEKFVPSDEYRYIMGLARPSKYELIEKMKKKFKINFDILVHPNAHIGSNVSTGEGTIIAPGTVIAPNVHIGDFVIINRNVSIGHDTKIGNFSNVGPAANIAGSSKIDDNCIISMGALILDHIMVGSWAIIGAGAVVTKDIEGGMVAVGVPAKPIKTNS